MLLCSHCASHPVEPTTGDRPQFVPRCAGWISTCSADKGGVRVWEEGRVRGAAGGTSHSECTPSGRKEPRHPFHCSQELRRTNKYWESSPEVIQPGYWLKPSIYIIILCHMLCHTHSPQQGVTHCHSDHSLYWTTAANESIMLPRAACINWLMVGKPVGTSVPLVNLRNEQLLEWFVLYAFLFFYYCGCHGGPS